MQVFFGSAIVFHCSLQWIQCWLDMDAGGVIQPCLDMWLLEVDAVSENRLVRWQSPVPVLRETETAQTKKEEVSKTFKRPKQKGARCRNTELLESNEREQRVFCSVD